MTGSGTASGRNSRAMRLLPWRGRGPAPGAPDPAESRAASKRHRIANVVPKASRYLRKSAESCETSKRTVEKSRPHKIGQAVK